ncbi:patatin-like phospholipase family protein [Spirochaeta africana]|uniref:Putative esterase of the alpha-beta hydrolase superfamily n=1 Tax=Spirochaeta africana (strain ATCC 700263 / DSM 8902 / Z-7692) TaxID=889378 RepID=H9UFR5_SPIAZ|nr:patatin-like phospholipase family protein [Spirochaeta africana]AFG36358.1 putative esterase of the alpha-beta hydrolase superfamily [Spirochaeta africana DSM 8902]
MNGLHSRAIRRCGAALLCICLATPPAFTDSREQTPRPTVAVVLAGGGALGFAHIGVLEMIEELGIPVDMVVGTSMGAIAGGLYSIGYRAADLQEIVESVDWIELFAEPPPRVRTRFQEHSDGIAYLAQADFEAGGSLLTPGMISGNRISNLLRLLTSEYRGEQDFDALPTRFRAIAADLETGEEVVLGAGNLALAMRASMAVPGVFDTVEMDGRLLVDGGLVNNLPIDTARELGADIVIAVDLQVPLLESENILGIADVLTQTVNLVIHRTSTGKHELADIMLRPAVDGYTPASFGSAAELIERGREAAQQHQAELQQLSDELRTPQYYTQNPQDRSIPHTTPAVPWPRRVSLQEVRIYGAYPGHARRIRSRFPLNRAMNIEQIHSIADAVTNEAGYRSIEYQLLQISGEQAVLALHFEPLQEPYNYVRLGIGYESHFGKLQEEEFTAAVHLTAINLLTRGSRLELELRLGQNLHSMLEYHQPVIRGLQANAGLDYRRLQHTLHETDNPAERYVTDLGMARIGLQHEILGAMNLRAAVRSGWFRQSPVYRQEVSLPALDGWFTGILTGVELDTLDRFPFPSRGVHGSAYYSRSFSLSSDVSDYQVLDIDYRRYLPLTSRHTLSWRFRGTSALDTQPPLWDSRWVGGREDFPGYYRHELQRRQITLLGGGHYWQLPSLPPLLHNRVYASWRGGFGLASTADISRLLPGAEDREEPEMLWAVGVGLGVDTPIGALQIETAVRTGVRLRTVVSLGHHF